MNHEIAMLGGGCFWCLEAVFLQVKGVLKLTSGYAGGACANPSYAQVCTGTTGHAEVVKIDFDPRIISFIQLLEVFYGIHDPTTLNRQGNDVGTQYRSVIFCQNEAQKQLALNYIQQLSTSYTFEQAIVTQISTAMPFYAAEAYHQNYFATHWHQGYCQMVVAPKVAKFKQHFAAWQR